MAPAVYAIALLLASLPAETVEPSPIADAAEDGDWARVRQLLLEGGDPSQSQIDGMTALHWAAEHGNRQGVAQLLLAGSNPDATNRYGVTALSIAAQRGAHEITRQLLIAGAKPNATLAGGVTPLLLVARSGDVATVRCLLQAGAQVDARERRGTTALMWAASAGHADVVEALISAGADIEATTWVGFNALMFAAREGRLDAIEQLIAAGADVNAVTSDKKRGGERGPRPRTSALIMAVESAHFEAALRLVDHGADPNDQRSGYAPLHVLSWVRRPQRGDNPAGDPPPRGSGRIPPLRFVREIVSRGADPNLRLTEGKAGHANLNPKGATPFVFAAMTADVPLMQTLLTNGADPNIATHDRTTALMAAAGIGAKSVGEHPGTEEEVIEAIELLVELGADVDAVDKNNQTAMHGAAYRNYPRAVTRLADLGANASVWNIKNHHGSTPEQIAKGRRPGSLKPSPETVAALQGALRADSSAAKPEVLSRDQ
ncbi:MAG: ankyrin repeat domain-containing protein [Planctomycetota bacterium]